MEKPPRMRGAKPKKLFPFWPDLLLVAAHLLLPAARFTSTYCPDSPLPAARLTAGHAAAGFAFVGIDRDEESVPVRVGESVPLHISAVLEGAEHLEAVVVLRPEIFHVLQHHALTVRACLALQSHSRHLPAAKSGVDHVTGASDLDGSFLYFQFAPFQTVGLEDHGGKGVPLCFVGGGVEGDDHPCSLLFRAPLVAKISGQPVFGAGEIGAARVAFAHLDRHVEFAVRMLSVFIEITGTEQMTAAGFHVIGLHLPCRLSRGRGHEDKRTKTEAYPMPEFHIRLLVVKPHLWKGTRLALASGRILQHG